jgi:prolyl-tRNA synthetase
MLWTRLFIPTLREDPAEAGVFAHKLLLRAGYMRRLSPGAYSYLPLGRRSLARIAAIVRQEMEALGAQEFLFPAPQPAGSLEAVAAATAGGELRSYKQLPQLWYQIQAVTHNAYSFDLDAAALDALLRSQAEACGRILARCGLDATHSGARFLSRSRDGDDVVATCAACGSAHSRPSPPPAPDPEGELTPEPFHTPAVKTIAELAAFSGLPETSLIKTLVMVADGRPCLVLLRGDHQLSDAKFAAVAGAVETRPAQPDELRQWLGAEAGSLGPVGARNLRLLADDALRGRRNLVSGANRDDYHLRNVTPGRDFTAEFRDLRQTAEGDTCARCGAALALARAIELGRTASLGPAASVRITTADRREVVPSMGSCRLAIDRILDAAAEAGADSDGLCLPPSIAPFHVVITPVSLADAAQREGALEIYRASLARGLDALLDDRDERPGVKFKDADLVGIPYRITVGRKLADGVVELVERRTRQKTDRPAASVAGEVAGEVHKG